MSFYQTICAGVLALVLLGAASARGASSKDPNWPCIQRKVPEITAGVVWSGPELPENNNSWKASSTVSDLVERLSQRRIPLEDANQNIDAFATTLQADKHEQLTLLFSGLLQTVNQERIEIMAGIERYAKRQHALAARINDDRHALSAVLKIDELSNAQRTRRDELEQKLSWDTRVFDERQQSLTYVCEVPVLLEQRLFSLGRRIQQHLN